MLSPLKMSRNSELNFLATNIPKSNIKIQRIKLLFFMKFYIPCKISLYRSLIDTFHPLLYVIFTTYLFPKFCVLLFVITIDDFVRLNIFS